MTYLAVIFACLVTCFLIVKLAKWATALNLVLLATTIIGLLIIPLNATIGIYMAVWSICLILIFWILFGVTGFITLIVITPFKILLGAIGLLKK